MATFTYSEKARLLQPEEEFLHKERGVRVEVLWYGWFDRTKEFYVIYTDKKHFHPHYLTRDEFLYEFDPIREPEPKPEAQSWLGSLWRKFISNWN